jgi:hypothetical protein
MPASSERVSGTTVFFAMFVGLQLLISSVFWFRAFRAVPSRLGNSRRMWPTTAAAT